MKKKAKQITAWICIILLVLLYAVTFLAAVLDFPGSDALFRSCLIASVALPVLLWIYIWLYGKVKEGRTGISTNMLQTDGGLPEADDKTLTARKPKETNET